MSDKIDPTDPPEEFKANVRFLWFLAAAVLAALLFGCAT